MPTDLEHQLAASLPGRPTAMHDYVRLNLALDRVARAIAYLDQARAELSVAAGEQRAGVARADEARLAARRMYADIEVAIRATARAL